MSDLIKGDNQEEQQPGGTATATLVPPPDRKARHRREAEGIGKPRKKPFLVAFITSRRLHTILILALIIYLCVLIPHLFWERTPDIPLKMMIVDKTVPFQDYREHRGLFWLLTNNKFVDPTKQTDNRFYAEDLDYTGFYPPPDDRILAPPEQENAMFSQEFNPNFVGPVPSSSNPAEDARLKNDVHWRFDYIDSADLADRDLLYICDSYGVYSADYWQFRSDYWGDNIAHTIYSPKIYGGMKPEEITAIEGFLDQGGRTICAEFNTLASPTDEELRDRLEEIFGVDWTHWIGRYFVDFGDVTDVPWWLFELYKQKHGKDWDLTGSGYLLCKDGEDEFFVLTDADDVAPGGMLFVPRTDYMEMDVMQGSRPSTFTYWFDVVTVRPDPSVQILADFEFKLTDSGKDKMRRHDLPLVIPAIVRKETHYNSYYMAGEMTEFGKAMGPADTKLTLQINRSFYGREVQGSTGFPFWHSSYPVVTNILRKEADLISPIKVPVYPFR
ncbi:hypothetical protein KDL29_04330 [bacterium]|nr:hypothetical protein [bacterium]